MLDWQVTRRRILLQKLLYSYLLSNLTVPYSDYNSLVRSQALKQWQLRWNSETQNKLHMIEPRVNVINLFRLPHRNENIIHKLRIGHIYLMHEHLRWGETPPRCLACQVDCWAYLASLCIVYKCLWWFFLLLWPLWLFYFECYLTFHNWFHQRVSIIFIQVFYHLHIICVYPLYQHLHCS